MGKKPQKPFIDINWEKAAELIRSIQDHRKADYTVAIFCYDYPIETRVAYLLNKLIRRLTPNPHKFDLILESGGGQIDTAAKIAKLCVAKDRQFTVLVPFYAKSAATLIALKANEVIMTPAAELGPLDPQVQHPIYRDTWIPARSIQQALSFIESASDSYVKLSLADKLDPFLVGAYMQACEASEQYAAETFDEYDEPVQQELSNLFTRELASHGYPIDIKVCQDRGLDFCKPASEALADLLSTLHEFYVDSLSQRNVTYAVIIQDTASAYGYIGLKDQHISIEHHKPEPVQTTPSQPHCTAEASSAAK